MRYHRLVKDDDETNMSCNRSAPRVICPLPTAVSFFFIKKVKIASVVRGGNGKIKAVTLTEDCARVHCVDVIIQVW